MSDHHDDAIVRSVRLYRQCLTETRQLYVESGQLVRGTYGWLTGGDHEDAVGIAEQMEQLHQGLVMKVFATVAGADAAEDLHRRQMGRALLEHIWGRSVMGHGLRDAVRWLVQTADDLPWADLLRPFAEIPSIRDRAAAVQSLGVRQAKLIASVDGSVDHGDRAVIDQLSRTLSAMPGQMDAPESASTRRGHRGGDDDSSGGVPAGGRSDSAADVGMAREAIAWLRGEAKRLREGAPVVPPRPTPLATGDSRPVATGDPTPIATGGSPPVATANPAIKQTLAPPDDRSPEQRLADARAKLDRLVGLDAIKEQIQTLTNFLAMQRHRVEADLPTTSPSLHMAFVGNPGTGKTTVARIVAEIYGALGVLAKGHLVETDRSGLVAEYAGQTGPKTNATIDTALDGVLFIDEAYTLIDASGQDQYGREAIQTLLKRMEDQRDRLVVILAGYPAEMSQMIRSNPGLSSRVGTTMTFEDYPPKALCEIFELIASKAKYELPTASRQRLLRGMTYLYNHRDRHFGNGRCSRNSFERSVRRMANRIASATEVTRELLVTLEPGDIEVAGLTMQHLDKLMFGDGPENPESPKGLETPGGPVSQVRLVCPHCAAATVVGDDVLATETTCPSCHQTHTPSWGEPVAGS